MRETQNNIIKTPQKKKIKKQEKKHPEKKTERLGSCIYQTVQKLIEVLKQE